MTQRDVELVAATMAGMAGAIVGFIVHDRFVRRPAGRLARR
jgi:biopolymer transport protein ExbB/TolQ